MTIHKQRASIVRKILLPLMLLSIFQTVLIAVMMELNGAFSQSQENALVMLDERTQNKHQILQTDMTVNWAYLSGTADKVLDLTTTLLTEKDKTFASIADDAELNTQIVQAIVPELVARIRSNNTTGIFVILNGDAPTDKAGAYAGVYLRDSEPGTDRVDNGDILVYRGSQLVFQLTMLMPDKQWLPYFTFPDGSENPENNYFFSPLMAAESGVLTAKSGGYWSLPFAMDQTEYGKVITYSEPLFNKQGDVYGVIGVEISVQYLTDFLSGGEFARSGRGCYFLGVTEDGGVTYQKVSTGGEKYTKYFDGDDDTLLPAGLPVNNRISIKSTRTNETMRGTLLTLPLYSAASAFSRQKWALIGMEDEATVFSFSRALRNIVIISALLSIILGITVSWLLGRRIVKPIVLMADSLEISEPNEELWLPPTNIREINRLSDAIRTMNRDAIESATRLSTILKMAGLPIGVFEIRGDSETAYCSDDVFMLLDRQDLYSENNLVSKTACLEMVRKAMQNPVEDSVYRLSGKKGERFVRIMRMQEQNNLIGTILDVTTELENRRRIEQERDYDLLTGLLNRLAFEKAVNALFADAPVLKVAAMIMFDLDNLKFLNDTFGHDCGDGYIRTFAEALCLFGTEKVLIARRSGDEFLVFLYGGRDKQEIREHIASAWKGILSQVFLLPDNTYYRIRVSAGVAWYPDEAETPNELTGLADFTMYKVKRNAKGTIAEFDPKDYGDYMQLVSGRDALDRLIDKQQIRFMGQPIFSAANGKISGYELQMRTDESELPDPQTVVRLARAEGKLNHIELLTWLKGLQS
ncbi:MAG: diguanylate cyclase, partial [Eubacteriales bacterium]|nr:diguanylate cyclase [Eubacteriales bacterium]